MGNHVSGLGSREMMLGKIVLTMEDCSDVEGALRQALFKASKESLI